MKQLNPAETICNALGGDKSPNAIIQTKKILDALTVSGWIFAHESDVSNSAEEMAEMVWNGICNAATQGEKS